MTTQQMDESRISSLIDAPPSASRSTRVQVMPDFADRVVHEYATAPRKTSQAGRRMVVFIVASGVTISSGILAVRAITQQAPLRTLGPPLAEFPVPFTEVRGVRELSDGRVVVNDFRDRLVKLVDFAASTVRQIGRHGSGPGEYLMPLSIIPLGRDSTGVYDMADHGDVVVILPDGTPGPSLDAATALESGANVSLGSRGDGRGFIYSERRGSDSTAIERFDRSTSRREVVGRVSSYPWSPLINRPAGVRGPGGRGAQTNVPARGGGAPPFMTHDQWAVANDGRVAVVSVDPYRVTFTETDGRRWTAPPISTSPIRVSEGHKAEWRAEEARPRASISISNGTQVAGFTSRPVREPVAWPEFLPPFAGSVLSRAVSFAPNGMLWVERTTAAGAPAQFDIIDQRGRVVLRVQFPPRTTLAGFGATTIYAVRRDSDDLEYLQKYNLP